MDTRRQDHCIIPCIIFVGRLSNTKNMILIIVILGLGHGLKLQKQKLSSSPFPSHWDLPLRFFSVVSNRLLECLSVCNIDQDSDIPVLLEYQVPRIWGLCILTCFNSGFKNLRILSSTRLIDTKYPCSNKLSTACGRCSPAENIPYQQMMPFSSRFSKHRAFLLILSSFLGGAHLQ